jgi:hypothetical protein
VLSNFRASDFTLTDSHAGVVTILVKVKKLQFARRISPVAVYVWALPNTALGAVLLPAAMVRGGRMRVVSGVLEVDGPLIAAILRHLPIRGGASAITFGHIVLGCDADALDVTRAHERVHVRQCERWGPLFIPAYLLASLWACANGSGAYAGNYFEREAFSASESLSSSTPHGRIDNTEVIMLEYLKALAARVLGRTGGSFLPPPEDPQVGVREPRRHGPGGKSSAVALMEPADDTLVRADGAGDNVSTVRARTDPGDLRV